MILPLSPATKRTVRCLWRHVLGSIGDVEVNREHTRNVDVEEVGLPFSGLNDPDSHIRVLGETAKKP